MTFFNKKEDIIKIELTPYGRSMLAQGQLKPSYYSFYDDDILYDTDKAGFSESNANSKGRILTGSVSLKPITNNKGVESNLNSMVLLEHENYLPYPIGTCKHTENKSAAWNATFLSNEISSSSAIMSSSTTTTLNIPQIDCEIEYKMQIVTGTRAREASIGKYQNPILLGGDYQLSLEEEDALIYLLEENGFKHKNSFQVQVYLYDEVEEKVQKLNFFKEEQMIKNDILNTSVNPMQTILQEPTPEEVEYYFELNMDNEIANENICKGIRNLKKEDIFLDLEYDCPDRDDAAPNIYKSSIGDTEDCD